MKRILQQYCSLFIWVVVTFSTNVAAYQPEKNEYSKMAQVTADGKGAIASVNSIATRVGLDAFKHGGNAVDAAAAVAFALGVVDSPNSGIGGGCFIVVRWPNGKFEAIDGREMAPAKAYRDMFLENGEYNSALSRTGALAIGVPGSVAALEYLVKKGGKLRWQDAILPGAEIAEKGFVIENYYANRLARSADRLKLFAASAAIFLDAKGNPYSSGSVLEQKDLAKTYRALAKQGSAYFYKGDFAKAVETWMKKNHGLITAQDFSNYEMRLRDPIVSEFKGYDIIGFPPPSSGGTHVAQLLNILEYFDLKKMSQADRYHVLIEAMKLVFADRAHWMGDADFAPVPRGLLDKGYAKQLQQKISLKKTSLVPQYNTPPGSDSDLFNRHTTHITVADSSGIWVSITTTLNTGFGSKVTIPGTGVLMNNQMDDFAAQPGKPNDFGLISAEANKVEPRKRPLSSMSPTIVLKEGKPVLAVGAAGGPTIINQVAQVLINRLALDMDLYDAVATARVHHQWKPDRAFVDSFLDENLRKDLEARGHVLSDWPPFGATQAIAWQAGKFISVAEPRLKSRM